MLLLLATLASADESTMSYDVYLAGKDVGDRTVTVRFLQRDDGERRVLSVVTKASAPIGEVSCRQSGQSSPRGANFTTSLQVGAEVSEVQGIQAPNGGWQLVRADTEGVHEAALKPTQVTFTTLDLFDPGRTRLLGGTGHVGVLVAETGAIVEGELKAGESTTVKVAGKSLAGTRYVVDGEGGHAEFVVDENGVLLSSQLSFFGGVMETRAKTVPEPRSFGTIDVVETPGSGTKEADL
ncbi:hypothetical protein LBMAG42_07650 [Deltaproteobacteria bacterium]|nr:hypothetical protein LBMAG42_07650 [Deltaproteobacteria bacterium]